MSLDSIVGLSSKDPLSFFHYCVTGYEASSLAIDPTLILQIMNDILKAKAVILAQCREEIESICSLASSKKAITRLLQRFV